MGSEYMELELQVCAFLLYFELFASLFPVRPTCQFVVQLQGTCYSNLRPTPCCCKNEMSRRVSAWPGKDEASEPGSIPPI